METRTYPFLGTFEASAAQASHELPMTDTNITDELQCNRLAVDGNADNSDKIPREGRKKICIIKATLG
jgi:hypothetical protein